MPSENLQCRGRGNMGGQLISQTSDVVDEKDVEVAIDVILNGADMVVEEDQSDRGGII